MQQLLAVGLALDAFETYAFAEVRDARVFAAGAAAGASIAGAIWVYTYKTTQLLPYPPDPRGNAMAPPRHLQGQPWWSPFAALALLLLGATIAIWLAPNRPRIVDSVLSGGA
jgi:hypothetical protein